MRELERLLDEAVVFLVSTAPRSVVDAFRDARVRTDALRPR